jgi:hypothetical protein
MKIPLEQTDFHTIILNDEEFLPDDYHHLHDNFGNKWLIEELYSQDGKMFIKLEGEEVHECFGVKVVDSEWS